MWPRFHLSDVRIVGHYLGSLVLIVGIAMLIPLVVALICHESSPAVDFLMGIGVDEKTAIEDACKMEHYISDATFQRIKAFADTLT